MEDLQLKTIDLVPAKIEFNKKAIEKELTETLNKYENLVFTEENTTDIRKVLAELRKGKTAADEFRKEKKKEASAPITAFEKEMKSIVKMFDDVINPINEQLQEFERKRKEEKEANVKEIITDVIDKFGLEQKYASQLDVDEQYLNKSFSLSQVKDTVEFRANNLLNEQKLEQMNKETIESFVKFQNSENSLNLSIVAYLSQLEFKDVESVKKTIEKDVEDELEARMKELVEIERKAEEERNQTVKEQLEEQRKEQEPISHYINDDLPFADIEPDNGHSFLEVYHVTGTMDEQNKLVKFMEDNGIEYEIEMRLPF